MKVYFTSSTAELFKYRKYYYAIRDFLVDENHVLTRDWLKKTEDVIDSGNVELNNIKDIYKSCMTAIDEADVVIIEDTVSNFSTGHQITIALQKQKPVLVLWKGEKHRHFKKMFIHGIESDILEVSQYTLKNYKEIISVFINKYSNSQQRNRFHLVLNNLERNYLDWVQFNQGKSRTKIIRSGLNKIIDEDVEYRKYLGNTSPN